MLRMADRLPDKGQKIRAHIVLLEQTLTDCDSIVASGHSTAEERKEHSRPSGDDVRSAGSGHPDGGVKLTDNTRLPPHVLREMYAGSASGNRLYGGRMTDERMQLVTSLTNEALESLHK